MSFFDARFGAFLVVTALLIVTPGPDMSRPTYFWLFLVFGEPLKTTDLSAMLLQYNLAGGGKKCRPHPFFPYLKD